MSLYDVTIPQFVRTLGNLEEILKKANAYADAKKFDMGVLLNTRLAPDMLPLGKNIQIATDTAKFCAAFLAKTAAPKFEDSETTYAEFMTRIAKTKEFLATVKAEQFNGAEHVKVELPRNPGEYLTGLDYVTTHTLPNFYFHVTVVYAILRANGVEIGKKDYLGQRPFKKI